jgi:hypothetical protein
MKKLGTVVAAAYFAAAHASQALSQTAADILHPSPPKLAAEAFNTQYGRLLAAETGRVLQTSADAECVRARKLTPETFGHRARELLVRNGAALLEVTAKLADRKKLESTLAAKAGKNARSDYERLRGDPAVKQVMALSERARLAQLADLTIQTTERHALLAGIRLAKPLSPLASGDMALLAANPADKALAERDRAITGSKSPGLKRWLEVDQAIQEAFQQSVDQDAYLRLGPRELTPDTEKALAALCVVSRKS